MSSRDVIRILCSPVRTWDAVDSLLPYLYLEAVDICHPFLHLRQALVYIIYLTFYTVRIAMLGKSRVIRVVLWSVRRNVLSSEMLSDLIFYEVSFGDTPRRELLSPLWLVVRLCPRSRLPAR